MFSATEERSFVQWMRNSNNLYSGDEYQLRLGIWLANKRQVQAHNAADKGFTVQMNKFAALTPSEYKQLLGHRNMLSSQKDIPVKVANSNAADVDWRTKGIVNAIKDQGQCGSCWAFSVVQAMESQYALKKSTLPSLSEQNLVDCVTTCYGCDGGDEYLAYDYVLSKQGGKWETEKDYPYTAKTQTCKFDSSKAGYQFSSYFRPTSTSTRSESELASGCATYGVVSIAIDASNWSFQLYSGGIYDESSCSSTDLDHAVGLVGYGTESSKDYWIVRNSWGTDWGESGYIRMIRNKKNQCGVASDTIIPQL
jgi:cathepsin L